MKKLIALLLALVMVFAMAACSAKTPEASEPKDNNLVDTDTKGMTESPLAAKDIVKDFEIKDDFKIGFICLHDEKSTYDKNFIDAANKVIAALGLTKDQYIIKTNIPRSSRVKPKLPR